MIKWLCNKIVQWGQDYDQNEKDEVYATVSNGIGKSGRRKGHRTIHVSDADKPDIPRTFRFDVSVGRGGVVLITRRYDAKRDETIEILNVIHDDQDISTQIGQIVAMEMLKS
jgi:plasmid stabilization system protein ParE